MKCFHFSKEDDDAPSSRVSKVSWVRSLSVASSAHDTRRSELESESRDFPDTVDFHEFLSQRRSNDLRMFGFAELRAATRGFSRALMIGEGGFGCVYRGVVRPSEEDPCSSMDVAIKQLNRNGLQGHKEWVTEVNFLGVVKHPNLVKLVGYCAEDDERGIQRLLVYEFMCNKSLEDHLLARVPSSSTLSWLMRLRIVRDAARGLAYLHEEMDFQLIFRDFKTSNILLDEGFNAKLSDFGLARQGPAEGLGHVSTSVVGTVGYAAPEYIQTGRLTAKSDVWSFGVVLYELITGRRAVDRNLPRSEQKLLEWVKPCMSDSRKFHIIIDPRLGLEYCPKSAQRLAALANRCLMKHPKSRPKMSEVVLILGQIIDGLNGDVPLPISEAKPVKDVEVVTEAEPSKEGSGKYLKRVFDLKEMMSLRNRTVNWRSWTPGLVRTW